jgi:2'-5' RNA ligase
VFVAVSVAPGVKRALAGQCEQLKQTLNFRKWVHPHDYHITLKFLGETEEHTLLNIQAGLRAIAQTRRPFALSAELLGAFGPKVSPRVLWSGIGGELEALRQLQRDVESLAEKNGFPPEKRVYAPHLTLARNCAGPIADEQWRRAQANFLPAAKEWLVEEIVLYATNFGKTPMYEPLARFSLMSGA